MFSRTQLRNQNSDISSTATATPTPSVSPTTTVTPTDSDDNDGESNDLIEDAINAFFGWVYETFIKPFVDPFLPD